jgi:hypothetical protein
MENNDGVDDNDDDDDGVSADGDDNNNIDDDDDGDDDDGANDGAEGTTNAAVEPESSRIRALKFLFFCLQCGRETVMVLDRTLRCHRSVIMSKDISNKVTERRLWCHEETILVLQSKYCNATK